MRALSPAPPSNSKDSFSIEGSIDFIGKTRTPFQKYNSFIEYIVNQRTTFNFLLAPVIFY